MHGGTRQDEQGENVEYAISFYFFPTFVFPLPIFIQSRTFLDQGSDIFKKEKENEASKSLISLKVSVINKDTKIRSSGELNDLIYLFY